MRIWAAAQGLTFMNIVSKENLDIDHQNPPRKWIEALVYIAVSRAAGRCLDAACIASVITVAVLAVMG
jgi:hypothetical protein